MVNARSATDARLVVRKSPRPEEELVLFVTHAPAGKIKPHVAIYIDALRLSGLATNIIVATDHVDSVEVEDLIDRADGLLIRENVGYDFAAWAHAMHHLDLSGTRIVCLANDSLIGPFTAEALQKIVARDELPRLS